MTVNASVSLPKTINPKRKLKSPRNHRHPTPVTFPLDAPLLTALFNKPKIPPFLSRTGRERDREIRLWKSLSTVKLFFFFLIWFFYDSLISLCFWFLGLDLWFVFGYFCGFMLFMVFNPSAEICVFLIFYLSYFSQF